MCQVRGWRVVVVGRQREGVDVEERACDLMYSTCVAMNRFFLLLLLLPTHIKVEEAHLSNRTSRCLLFASWHTNERVTRIDLSLLNKWQMNANSFYFLPSQQQYGCKL